MKKLPSDMDSLTWHNGEVWKREVDHNIPPKIIEIKDRGKNIVAGVIIGLNDGSYIACLSKELYFFEGKSRTIDKVLLTYKSAKAWLELVALTREV